MEALLDTNAFLWWAAAGEFKVSEQIQLWLT